MPTLTKQNLASGCKLAIEQYPIPEFGLDCHVCIRELSAIDLRYFQKKMGKTPDTEDTVFGYDVLHRCLVDVEGNQLYDSAADAEKNLNVSCRTFEALVKRCLEFSGIEVDKKN